MDQQDDKINNQMDIIAQMMDHLKIEMPKLDLADEIEYQEESKSQHDIIEVEDVNEDLDLAIKQQ